jgi:hypothetical protein
MAWKTPDYKKTAGLEEMGIEVFASGIIVAVVAAGAALILAAGALYVASALFSVEALSTEELELLGPYING